MRDNRSIQPQRATLLETIETAGSEAIFVHQDVIIEESWSG